MVRAARRACVEIHGSVDAAVAETSRVAAAITAVLNAEHPAVAYTALHCTLEVFDENLEAAINDQPIANAPV